MIFYIVCDSRSGSTLLENLLSKSDQIVSLGELHRLKSFMNEEGVNSTNRWDCGCGEPVKSCTFWHDIINDAGIKSPSELETMVYNSGGAFYKLSLNRKFKKTENKNVISVVDRIYEAVMVKKGTKVLVDSSKLPSQGYWISKYSGHDVRFIFLRREIGGVVLSKLKWMKGSKTSFTKFKILFFTLLFQRKINQLNKIVRNKCINISYQQLAQDPQRTIDDLMVWSGLERYSVPDVMYLEDDHTIGGTPNKFKKRRILYDDSWKERDENSVLFRALLYFVDSLS